MRSGAVVLEERPLGITILLLTEVPNISLELVNKFIVHTANQQYIKEVEAYLAGTANLTKPRVVEYTASATDCLGRLYGQRSLCTKTSTKGALTPIWNYAPGSGHGRRFL